MSQMWKSYHRRYFTPLCFLRSVPPVWEVQLVSIFYSGYEKYFVVVNEFTNFQGVKICQVIHNEISICYPTAVVRAGVE